jgi:hypothetical protein
MLQEGWPEPRRESVTSLAFYPSHNTPLEASRSRTFLLRRSYIGIHTKNDNTPSHFHTMFSLHGIVQYTVPQRSPRVWYCQKHEE